MSIEPSQCDYEMLSAVLSEHCGQVLSVNRHWRIDQSLSPIMRENEIPDIAVLVAVLKSGDLPELKQSVAEAMINNETSFFRDQANFALMTGPVLDAIWHRNQAIRKLRIWCSACSTGQEAYSIAMSICENAEKWAGWDIQIHATDISSLALDKARKGSFSQLEIQRGLPVGLMLRYFSQEGETWAANEKLRKMVRFAKHNLLQQTPFPIRFDLVLCRNMLMYLSEERRNVVLAHLADSLDREGYLMLGAAETVLGQKSEFISCKEFRGMYVKSGRDAGNAMPQSRCA